MNGFQRIFIPRILTFNVLITAGLVFLSFGNVIPSGAADAAQIRSGHFEYLPIICKQAADALQPEKPEEPDSGPEDFRQKLVEHYNDLLALYPYVAKAAPSGLAERIVQARQRVSEFTPEELAQIERVFSQNPILFEAPGELMTYFERVDASHQTASTARLQTCPSILPDNWCGCPSGLPNGMTDVYIAKGVTQGLEFLAAFMPSNYVFGAVVLGEGVVSTVWAHPAKIAIQVAYESALAAALIVEGIYAVNDACHQGYHRALLVDHDERVQWALDNEVELRKVHLQVLELTEKREFLGSASEAGVPLADIEFIAVQIATKNDPITFIDVTGQTTVSMVQQGVYLVQIDLTPGGGDPRIYTFQVKHTNDPVEHFGFTMFDRIGPRNLDGGQ